jgi:hypothetical protein
MATKQNLQVVETSIRRKNEPDPPALLENINTGLMILAFGGAWFVFLQGLTALGRVLKVWPF